MFNQGLTNARKPLIIKTLFLLNLRNNSKALPKGEATRPPFGTGFVV